jgi:hypothetical protein
LAIIAHAIRAISLASAIAATFAGLLRISNDNVAIGVDAMDLEHRLGDVETDRGRRGDLPHAGSSEALVASAATDSPALSRRGEEPSTASEAEIDLHF